MADIDEVVAKFEEIFPEAEDFNDPEKQEKFLAWIGENYPMPDREAPSGVLVGVDKYSIPLETNYQVAHILFKPKARGKFTRIEYNWLTGDVEVLSG